jgi:hypothetical protein
MQDITASEFEGTHTNQKSTASIEGNRYGRPPIGTRVDLYKNILLVSTLDYSTYVLIYKGFMENHGLWPIF